MNSFLLIEKQKSQQEKNARTFLSEKNIDPFDISLFDITNKDLSQDTQAHLKGIALIRHIIKTLSLKPLRGDRKALIILDAQSLSIPAQNALLKTLEEPPPHTIIVLCATSPDELLPTIISRCQIIQNVTIPIAPLPTTFKPVTSISQALTLAQELSKKPETAVEYLQTSVYQLEKSIVQNTNEEEFQQASEIIPYYIQTLHTISSTNVNLRFALENLFLTSLKKFAP